MKLRLSQPAWLIDIGRLPLTHIDDDSEGVTIGALTTHAAVAESVEIGSRWQVFSEAAVSIGDPIVRNHGTVGGNLAHADPASDLPAALLSLGGELVVNGPEGARRIPADSFFQSLFTTEMSSVEMITNLHLPTMESRTGSAYLKFSHPASGFAVCGAAAVVTLDSDGRCQKARLCFNGITEVPLEATAVATALTGTNIDDRSTDQAVSDCLVVEDPLADTFASGEYRTHLARVYARRALRLARDRAGSDRVAI